MSRILDRIDSPADLKGLKVKELAQVAEEVRELIIGTVSEVGGHLASSLGAVELTIALHYMLDTPEDKIVWDVGHQAYAHKILTGRRDSFHTLRQSGGISGFPKPEESPYDSFVAGHSSTSISAALGMAAARDLRGGTNKVVPIIGDGSLTAGLAFEGLNQAGHLKKNIIVILNDNEMSISENVGALSSFLSRKITGRFATRFKQEVETFIKSIPMIGERIRGLARRAEDSLITLFTPGMLFEGLGFHYVGPIDGHDIETLVSTLEYVGELKGPVLLHVLTKKGKGYAPAEAEPSRFHGVGPFDRSTGIGSRSSAISYTKVFSDSLVEIAERDPRVVAITAAMPDGTGLTDFAERFPERFFDVGIAEQHALTFAAGLAKEGYVPVAAIYSTFLQRAFDEVIHDVCLQHLPVVMALDRAGLVGADGPTHHGVFDLSYLRHLPNMVVAAPRDASDLRALLVSAVNYGCPVAVRYPRGAAEGAESAGPVRDIRPGTAEVLTEGTDISIIAIGTMVSPALDAAAALEKRGISAGVVDARFVKPLDEETIIGAAANAACVMTVEENALQGGFGSAVLELFDERGLGIHTSRLGIPDEFIEHGTQAELRSALGLDAAGIERRATEMVDSIREAGAHGLKDALA